MPRTLMLAAVLLVGAVAFSSAASSSPALVPDQSQPNVRPDLDSLLDFNKGDADFRYATIESDGPEYFGAHMSPPATPNTPQIQPDEVAPSPDPLHDSWQTRMTPQYTEEMNSTLRIEQADHTKPAPQVTDHCQSPVQSRVYSSGERRLFARGPVRRLLGRVFTGRFLRRFE